MQLLCFLPELRGDVEHLVLSLLQRPRLGLQCLSIFLQTLGLFAQLGHCAVEGT
uniref:Uncharacterized protein n=1 Tax=Anguilla anguilla TaxID=7936 RepID=A0A0E9U5V0_ANGAN